MQHLFLIVLIVAASWGRRGHGELAQLSGVARGGAAVPVAAMVGIVAGSGGIVAVAGGYGAMAGAQPGAALAGMALIGAAVGKAIEPRPRALREPTRSSGAIALAHALRFVASPAGLTLAGLALLHPAAWAVQLAVEGVFVAHAWTRCTAGTGKQATRIVAAAALAAGGVIILV